MADIFGTVGQIGLTILNNELAQQRADRDRSENYRYGEMAASKADWRTRQLYSDFYSPQALLKQYNAAGLSPSMMFGGTPGQGGMAGAQGSGSAGMQTPFMPFSMVEAAQAQALLAQARKTNAETDTLEGKTERGAAEISNILAQTGNTKAATALTNAQTIYQELQNYITDKSKQYSIDYLKEQWLQMEQQVEVTMWTAMNSELEYDYNYDTFNKRKEIVSQEYSKLAAETALTWSQKHLTDKQVEVAGKQIQWLQQQINESIAKIAQGWEELRIKNASLEAQKEYWQKQIENESKRINNEWEVKVRELDIRDEQIRQGYIGMGISVFDNAIKIGSQMIMLKGLKSRNTIPAYQTVAM